MELIINDAFLFSVTEMLKHSLREIPKCSSLSHCDAKHWIVFVNMFLCGFISFVIFSTGLRKYPTLENIKHFI